jgi:hypothetical protein
MKQHPRWTAHLLPGGYLRWTILLFVFSTAVGFYAVLYYRLGHHSLPLAPVAVILQPTWVLALLLFPLVILLFPDGRLTSRRWRSVLVAYAVMGVIVTAALLSPAIAAFSPGTPRHQLGQWSSSRDSRRASSVCYPGNTTK